GSSARPRRGSPVKPGGHSRTGMPSRIVRSVTLAVGMAGLATLASADAQEVSKETLDAARREGKVTIYGSVEAEIMQAAQQAFETKYGVKAAYWRAASRKVTDVSLAGAGAGQSL